MRLRAESIAMPAPVLGACGNQTAQGADRAAARATVRALAPSPVVSFDALGQQVSLKLGKGRVAQIWRVPATEARVVRDELGYGGQASLDALLRITDVQPGPGGGTITMEVIEHELHHSQNGQTIDRLRVGFIT